MSSPEEPLKILELLKSEVMNESLENPFTTLWIIPGLTDC